MRLKFEKKFLKKPSKLPREGRVRILAKLKIFEEADRGDLVKLKVTTIFTTSELEKYQLKN
ncbi:hypothetical protein [Ferroglobus sp.]|uniref:hypothetical protein n=1 Tax=Ferroglobus sp. TaxID=2614230 RepID=UPI0025C6E538|nr:hypothetical protein [Ferroglobus sp.]